MDEARGRDAWERTSHLCAVMANCMTTGSRRWQPKDFNPYKPRREEAIDRLTPKESVALLARLFGKNGHG